MELIKAKEQEYKNYIIQDGEVYQYKKNDSGSQPKPLKDKRIDKLIDPLIESIYNISFYSDNKSNITSLKYK